MNLNSLNQLNFNSQKAYTDLLETVVRQASEAIIVTKVYKDQEWDAVILYANEAFYKMTGYSSNEILNTSLFSTLNPQINDQAIKKIKTAISLENAMETQLVLNRKNGEAFWVNINSVPHKGGEGDASNYIHFYRELTYEVLLKESRQKYKSLFDNHPDAVFALDNTGSFTSVNEACESITGYSKNELLRLKLQSLIISKEKEKAKAFFWKAMEGRTNTLKFTIKTKDKRSVVVNITQIPIKVDEVIKGVYGIAQDITETQHLANILNIEKNILKEVVEGKGLQPTLASFLKAIEHIYPNMLLSILLSNNEGTYLNCYAAPSLPEELIDYLKETPIKEGVNIWGTTAFLQKTVIISHTKKDPQMAPFMTLLNNSKIKACWSYPILSSKGALLGILTVYRNKAGTPDRNLEQILERAINIIVVLIEARKAEDAYKQVNERLKLAMNATNEAVWDLDVKNNVIYWGDGFETVFGYPLDAMELTLDWWASNLHPDDKARVIDSINHTILSDESHWSKEYRYKAADGNYRYVLDRGRVIRDKRGKAIRMVGAVLDLTERKKTEENLRESEERFRNLADSTVEGIAISEKGIILDLNKSLVEMLGYTREELIGKSSHIFVSPEDHEKINYYIRTVKEDVYEITGVRKDGSSFPLEIRGINTNYKGRPARITSFRDVTERKQIEKELINYADELSRSNAELERFAYSASHDLQEPLRMVTSFLKLLKEQYEDKFDATGEKYIYYAIDGAERMKVLIKDLLKYSKISFQEEEKTSVDLNEILNDLKHVFAEMLEAKNGFLEVDNMPVVQGSGTLLYQLFQNFISNAIKYKGKEPPHIKITAVEKEAYWEFMVKDNGIGIEEKFHERVFVIFQRLHSREEYEGTGIGLAICKKIIEKYGGKVWLSSTPGKGSTFYFTLAK